MHRTNTNTVHSVISELQMSIRKVLAWYGTSVRSVRTLKQRTYVPYPYHYEKRVPYLRKYSHRTAILVLESKNRLQSLTKKTYSHIHERMYGKNVFIAKMYHVAVFSRMKHLANYSGLQLLESKYVHFLKSFAFILGLRLQRYSINTKRYLP